MQTAAYWVAAPGVGELRAGHVADAVSPGRSIVRAEFSAVSPGTERLVGLGRVPESCAAQMACRYMDGGFSLPVKYGYSVVGTAVAGDLAGDRVFVMHPHQELFEIETGHAVRLPDWLPAQRAALIPNTETALNAVWDADPGADEPVVVVGGGPVGLLIAFVMARLELGPVTVVDVDAERLAFSAGLPFVAHVGRAEDIELESYSVAFHTTGMAAGLQSALALVGFEGRVIDLSWYGDASVELFLGTHFHYGRKRILASQVGSIAPSRRHSHTFADRLSAVVDLLSDAAVESLSGPPVSFAEMPALMHDLYHGNLTHPIPLIEYPAT